MKKIRLFKPSVGKEELNNIKKVFNRSWLGYGPLVNKFEKKFAGFIGTKYAVAVNSGTAALHLSLLCNNFPKGKKVLVPSITFSATAASVLYCGLIPKFVDVREDDLTIDFNDLKKKYSNDCVALICVHMGGHPSQMEKIRPWAKRKKLILIEDSAESCGSIYKGKKIGTWSDISCFSFEEKKIITTGDGGMICLNDKKKYEKLKSLSFHGWDTDPWKRHNKSFGKNNRFTNHWAYEIKTLGYKYNMNDLMAALGLEQLKKIKTFNYKREKILKRYLNGIKDLKNIKPTYPYKLKNSSYWLFSVKTKFRDELINYLKIKNISTAVHFVPLPYNKIYKKYKNNSLKNTMRVWKQIVSLPFFPDLENKKVDYILNCLKTFDRKISKNNI
ncbi:MAG: UDP-4-amino-4-deoxy-L-arabinose-oxoglutarate aminotransferase [Pelagibacteraceae bacterium]|nr:UDP-4-amino-4-deoxy-L-arabinose-oxoglutarate aminotransferase [Pelagibacteraceae bacterium]|tara:strand:- start:7744 stop:8904 length:1161 start_codon:yes stop_codon:yes gene_type:complete